MIQIQQIIPGSEEYPNDPILFRGSVTKKILCFGDLITAVSFTKADGLSGSSFAIFENYATFCESFTQVIAVNYFTLGKYEVCEFKQNEGDRCSLFTCEWKSKYDKEFLNIIYKYYPSYDHLIES
jgi:hypothetical protein